MVKRDSYMNRLIHNMWNGEIKVIVRMDVPHNFYDDNGIFHCNLIDLLLGRVELF